MLPNLTFTWQPVFCSNGVTQSTAGSLDPSSAYPAHETRLSSPSPSPTDCSASILGGDSPEPPESSEPEHPTTSAALRSYANRRDAHLGSRCGSTFFAAEQGGRLRHQYVHRVFWRLSREIGLRRPDDRRATRARLPAPKNVEQQLPVPSTYLGCVRDTYWYLSACPELMEEAARRLDRRWEATP